MWRMIHWRLWTADLFYKTVGRPAEFLYFDDTVTPTTVRVTPRRGPTTLLLGGTT